MSKLHFYLRPGILTLQFVACGKAVLQRLTTTLLDILKVQLSNFQVSVYQAVPS